MTISIWLEPTKNDAKYLRKIIRDLAKKYGAPEFPPHLTLHSGLTCEKAMDCVRNCKATPHLARVLDIKHSDYLWKTVFIRIYKNNRLEGLNKTITECAGTTKYVFEPHISLLYKRLDARTKKKIIRDLKIKSRFTFDRITINKTSRNVSEWKRLKMIRLCT
jgi:2'-5' RNA ligase